VSMLAKARSLIVPFRFALVGAVNTLIGLLIIYALVWAFHVHDVLANAVGYAVGMAVSFLLNARWTFSFRGPLRPAFWRFITINLIGYLTNLAAVSFSLYALSLNSYIAQAIGVLPYALATFVGFKYFVFIDDNEARVCRREMQSSNLT